MRDKFNSWVFKMRGGLWTLLFVIIFVMARPTARSFFYGLFFVIIGQLWRFWAAGCIGRYRGENVGAVRLATWGPYALMRNPLYFGNFLIGLGWAVMAGFWAVPVFIAGFIILYVMIIIPYEEEFLTKKFGVEYENYKSSTGMFSPRKGFKFSKISGSFDAKILWQSERHTVITTVVGSCIIAAKMAF